MPQVIWTLVATQELEDILFYVSYIDRRPLTGERLFHELRNHVDRHAANGVEGQRHPQAPVGWLYAKFKRWLIFYRPTTSGIEVMRVIDAVRDLPRQF